MEWMLEPPTPTQEYIVKAIALTMCFARTVLFLWRLFRHRPGVCSLAALSAFAARVRAGVKGFIVVARDCLGCPALSEGDGDSEHGAEVASLLASQILTRQCTYMRKTLSTLGYIGLMLRTFNAVMPSSFEEQQFETTAQRWCVLAISLFSFPDDCWSSRLSPQARCSVRFGIQMIYLCAYVLTSQETAALLLTTSLFCAMLRLIIGMASLNLRHVVFWSTLTTVLTCYRYTHIYKSALPPSEGGMVDLGVQGCIIAEVISWILVISCAAIYTNLVHSEVSHAVQATKLRRDAAATTRMLELVCDVVVELDGNLAIKDNATRFAAMLSLNPQKVQGSCLHEYMLHDEDRQRFQQQLEATKEDSEGSLPGVMHVTMRGGCGTSISTEIFYLHFRSSGGEDRFLAGIQETPDHRPIAELKNMTPCRSLRLDAGTPPSGDDPPASSRTSETISTKSLLVQRCSRTTKGAEDLSLLACLLTWNVAVRSSSCCAYHGYLDEGLRSLSRLRSRRCLRTFCPSWEAQCDHCGLFALWDDDLGQAAQKCGGCNLTSVKRIKNLSRL